MVFKKTEYQRQFTQTVLLKDLPSYKERSDLRNRLRAQGCSHTPFCWIISDESDEDSFSEGETEKEKHQKGRTMVVKHSEYQKQFNRDLFQKGLPYYVESLTFRNRRKAAEYAHTPISWDSDSESDGDSLCEEQKAFKKRERDSRDFEQNNSHIKEKADLAVQCADFPEEKMCMKDEGSGQKLFLDKVARKQMETNSGEEMSGAKGSSQVPQDKVGKEFSPTKDGLHGKKLHCPVSSPVLNHRADHPAPFANYGWANVQKETGNLRTYNARAESQQVYDSALQALQRRKVEWKKLKNKKQQLIDRGATKQSRSASEAEQWTSSYKKDFISYDNSVYARNLMALRAVPVVSHCKFQAV